MNTTEKEALEVLGLILTTTFYTMLERETLDVVGSILESLFYKDTN